jgi:NAD-dependent dihydropyrimidine dehydrogenase PreA subunit
LILKRAMSVLVDIEKCKGCGVCVSLCPVQAVSIMQNKAFIDQNKCNECLLCMDECPENAIHQISEKEVYLTKREHSIPYSLKQTVPHTRQSFSSNEWKQQAVEKGGMFLNEVKKALGSFFEFNSSSGISRRGEKIKHRRHRRRYRGGRF